MIGQVKSKENEYKTWIKKLDSPSQEKRKSARAKIVDAGENITLHVLKAIASTKTSTTARKELIAVTRQWEANYWTKNDKNAILRFEKIFKRMLQAKGELDADLVSQIESELHIVEVDGKTAINKLDSLGADISLTPLDKNNRRINVTLNRDAYTDVKEHWRGKTKDWKYIANLPIGPKGSLKLNIQYEISSEEIKHLKKLRLACASISILTDKLNQEAVKCIGNFQNLKNLSVITDGSVDDQALAWTLGNLKNLEEVLLVGCVGERSIQKLGSLTKLQKLILGGDNKLSGNCLKPISKLKNLRELSFVDPVCSGNAIADLAGCKNLVSLKLSSNLDDKSSKHLAKLTGVKYLEINSDNITDRGLNGIAKMKMLKKLDLRSEHITDSGVKTICNSSDLVHLTLVSPQLTDESFKTIANSKLKLDSLGVTSRKITANGLIHFISSKISEISLGDGDFKKAAVNEFIKQFNKKQPGKVAKAYGIPRRKFLLIQIRPRQ